MQSKLKEKGLPWEKAKAFDNSAIVGSFIGKDQFSDMNDIHFSMKQNGVVVQKASTAQMIWKIDELIADISKYFTLKTGDLIFTGTPVGVGKVNPNDLLEGYLFEQKVFELEVK